MKGQEAFSNCKKSYHWQAISVNKLCINTKKIFSVLFSPKIMTNMNIVNIPYACKIYPLLKISLTTSKECCQTSKKCREFKNENKVQTTGKSCACTVYQFHSNSVMRLELTKILVFGLGANTRSLSQVGLDFFVLFLWLNF